MLSNSVFYFFKAKKQNFIRFKATVPKNKIFFFTNSMRLNEFVLMPEYILGSFGLLSLTVLTFSTYKVFELQGAVGKSLILSLIVILLLYLNDHKYVVLSVSCFQGSSITDSLSLISKIVLCIFGILYFGLVGELLSYYKITAFEYLIVMLVAFLGLLLLCSSNDLLSSYIAIELSSIAFYLLVGFRKKLLYSLDAGLKYYITGAISSSFFLFGSSILYILYGSINFEELLLLTSFIFANQDFQILFSPFSVVTGFNIQKAVLFDTNFLLIIFSLFIKLGIAPFHLWSLDVYEGAPTSSSIFLSVLTKLSVLILIIRLTSLTFYNNQYALTWEPLMGGIGMFGIIVGVFGGITQRQLKILLTYSAINNLGLIILALSNNCSFSLMAILFYTIVYIVSSFSSWAPLYFLRLKIRYQNRISKDLSDFTLLQKTNPTLAFCLTLVMFSLAGTPPLLGFVSKMTIFLSLISGGASYIVFVALLSVISAFYYLRIIKCLYFENVTIGLLFRPIYWAQAFVFSFSVSLLVFLFINPTSLFLLSYLPMCSV